MCEAFFLTVFINILIIDLYIWFTVAIAVRKELKLDSTVSLTPHQLCSCLLLPGLKTSKHLILIWKIKL